MPAAIHLSLALEEPRLVQDAGSSARPRPGLLKRIALAAGHAQLALREATLTRSSGLQGSSDAAARAAEAHSGPPLMRAASPRHENAGMVRGERPGAAERADRLRPYSLPGRPVDRLHKRVDLRSVTALALIVLFRAGNRR